MNKFYSRIDDGKNKRGKIGGKWGLRGHRAEGVAAGGVRISSREIARSFFEEMAFDHSLEVRCVVTWGHMFQREGMVCAKALRQEPVWCAGRAPK